MIIKRWLTALRSLSVAIDVFKGRFSRNGMSDRLQLSNEMAISVRRRTFSTRRDARSYRLIDSGPAGKFEHGGCNVVDVTGRKYLVGGATYRSAGPDVFNP